jgi:hypothetical protein
MYVSHNMDEPLHRRAPFDASVDPTEARKVLSVAKA